MTHKEKLLRYCEQKLLSIDFDEDGDVLLVELNDVVYELIGEKVKLFNGDFEFLPKAARDSDGAVYEFGGKWYLQLWDEEVTLTPLVYVGKAVTNIKTESFLGIRSGQELMNGVGNYSDYIKKAKFLGTKSLGICEKNTLRGALGFQTECLQNGIKPIIGITVTVGSDDITGEVKVYARNFRGWQFLLKMNTILNVEEKRFVPFDFFDDFIDDIYVVLDPKTISFENVSLFGFSNMYQLDTVYFLDNERDASYLKNLELFMRSDLSPVSITDSFYLEPEYYETRELLWKIAKSFDEKTNNQYFKSKDEYISELMNMFDDGNRSWIRLIKEAINKEKEIADGCNFTYDVDTRHLPKYVMTEDERSQFGSNEEFFMHLVKTGFKKRDVENPEKYIDRLKKEIKVLRKGDVIDYFLGLYAIIQYAESRGMLTGIGRGSAGGSLVAYLLGITKLDPMEFDLIFERFLNEGRMGEFVDRPAWEIETDTGDTIVIKEGDLLRIKRNGKEEVVFGYDLKEGDEILKY